MTLQEMRAYISDAYPGRSWKARCSVMREQQVVAIYHSLQNRKKEKAPAPKRKKDQPGYQFTIYDFMD